MVLVEGELWRATSEGGPLSEGEEVVIVAVDGLKLRVRKAERS
jgi:membrane-bound ClpP family serine protease